MQDPQKFHVKRVHSSLSIRKKEKLTHGNSSYFDVQSRSEFEPTEQTHHVIYVNLHTYNTLQHHQTSNDSISLKMVLTKNVLEQDI